MSAAELSKRESRSPSMNEDSGLEDSTMRRRSIKSQPGRRSSSVPPVSRNGKSSQGIADANSIVDLYEKGRLSMNMNQSGP